MRRFRGVYAVIAAAIVAACTSEETPAEIDTTLTPGISYVASTSVIDIDGTPRMLVTLDITNSTISPITLTYPAGCPVRIRLYDPEDNRLAYDETRLVCNLTTPATLTISPAASKSLGSGFRGMRGIAGDSLPLRSYRVVAVPQTEELLLEIPAGTVVLRQ